MNLQDLVQYRLELIAEQEAEIAAIDRLIARERNKPPASVNNGSTAGGVPITARARYRSVRAVVKAAVGQIPGKFTRKEVADRIALIYPAAKISTRSVAVELWKLARAKEIETVEEGRGRIPATYKRK